MKRNLPVSYDRPLLAYIVGIALGDGNLSNPNGRATRLRVTCDLKYPKLINKIQTAITSLFPNNKVSFIKRDDNCLNISCYSNEWEKILGWTAGNGPKLVQNVSIPNWVKINRIYKINCLRGLIETDGSIYLDRGYKTVMITSAIPNLAKDIYEVMLSLKFKPRFYSIKDGKNFVYHIRVATEVNKFLDLIKPEKI